MDLWLFEGKTLGDTVQRAWDLWGGRHVHSDQVHRISFRSIEMESESPTFLQVDGEPLEGRGKVSIEVKPRALHVLVPDDAPRPLFRVPWAYPDSGLQ